MEKRKKDVSAAWCCVATRPTNTCIQIHNVKLFSMLTNPFKSFSTVSSFTSMDEKVFRRKMQIVEACEWMRNCVLNNLLFLNTWSTHTHTHDVVIIIYAQQARENEAERSGSRIPGEQKVQPHTTCISTYHKHNTAKRPEVFALFLLRNWRIVVVWHVCVCGGVSQSTKPAAKNARRKVRIKRSPNKRNQNK